MKPRSDPRRLPAAKRLHRRELVLGVDGGGTKTRAVIVDAAGEVLGEGLAGPSNPLRVGVVPAALAVRVAVERACAAAHVRRGDIAAAQVGLAGSRRSDLRERMREALVGLGIQPLEVVTDADIALFGATDGKPGLIIIAGTGSICCGMNGRGRRLCAGGCAVARAIIDDAGRELGATAAAVIRGLHMGRGRFRVGYVGGVFAAGQL